MSTKAAMATQAADQIINFTLGRTPLGSDTVAYFFPDPHPQIVVKPGDKVQFAVNIPNQFGLQPDQVASYITFTGTNSKGFSAEDPIPWPFLDGERDSKTGYQIVLKANGESKKYTVRKPPEKGLFFYSYSVVVKVNAPTILRGSGEGSFYEFREDPEIYVDEC